MANSTNIALSFVGIFAASAVMTAMLLHMDPPAGAQEEASEVETLLAGVGSASSQHVTAEAPLIGVAVGDLRPDGLEAQDQLGRDRSFSELVGASGLVLYFARSVDWCPYCQAQAIHLNERMDDFLERGYGVAMVTTDTVAETAAFAARRDIRFSLLSDPDSEIIAAWNQLDPAFEEGSRNYGLPYPTTYVLNASGEVEAVFFNEATLGEARGYVDRVDVDDVIASLDE